MSGKYLTKTCLPAGRDISRRLLGDMSGALFNENAAKGRENEIFYTVFRNIETVEGRARYDITEIPAGNIGGEFNKTFGHYHKNALPEVYEVLEGHAYFLLQNPQSNPAEIKEVYIVEAEKGEKAVIPGNFGHLSINVGSETLVLANWIGFTGYDYETIKKLTGGCYYVLDARLVAPSEAEARRVGQTIEFEQNKNYKMVPELKKLKLKNSPALEELGIRNDKSHPILDLKKSPEKLDWLAHPEKYEELLTIEKLYKKV